MRVRSLLGQFLTLSLAVVVSPAWAVTFDWDIGEGVSGVVNTSITLGAAWRMEDRANHLVSKANLNPNVCPEKICQGIYQGDTDANLPRLKAPGAFSNNLDDGNLNYDKHDMVQGVAKIISDITLSYKEYGFFGRAYAFYDFVNVDFEEYHPNRIIDGTPATGPSIIQSAGRDAISELLGLPIDLPVPGIPGVTGVPTYGPGQVVRNKRAGGEMRDQIGANAKIMDAYLWGFFPMPGDRELQLKLGRQSVNWGESVVLAINSLNQINPPNLNHLARTGLDLVEVFEPVGLLYASMGLTDNTSIEAFYQYEWRPVEIFAPGSFLSFLDLGTNNLGDRVDISLGSAAESFSDNAFPVDNVLAAITNTTLSVKRLPDNEPEDAGQYGVAFRYYAEWLNNGTELAFYAMNYHSRLPYVSFYATDASCAKREGNALGIDAFDTASLLAACPDLPLTHHITGDPENATSNVLLLNSARVQLEYPEDIQLYGMSFNTSFGELALQGELAYRPELPIQIDAEDLAFAAFQPTLTRCSPGSSAAIPCVGTVTSGPNTFALGAPVAGDLPGAARSFPNYVLPYRGLKHDELAAHSYIRGWENFESYQFNLGGTYVFVPNLFGMNQFLFLFEIGAQYVPDLPGPCELPLEAPGTFTHPSAGADGTGTVEGGGRVCHPRGADVRNNDDGSDGLRFNPTQQLDGFPDALSYGYRLIMIPRWDSILPGISIEPLIIFGDDVKGTSPGPGESFLEGRQSIITDVNIRWRTNWQFHVGYSWFRGAEPYNQIGDRDYASAYVRYSF